MSSSTLTVSKPIQKHLIRKRLPSQTPRPGRVAIFIDGSNVFYAALSLGVQVDYAKFLHYLAASSESFQAFFYTGVDPAKPKEQGFLWQLRQKGYQVVEKEIVKRSDGSKKANLDVEIALDMVLMATQQAYDTAILVSGDGDFTYAVHTAQSLGVQVKVIGLRSMTSEILRNAANTYIDLALIRDQICRSPNFN